MKIDETWSAVGLNVEAFSVELEAFSQKKLVLKSGGRTSLPGEAGKRVQEVGAPFHLQLENERRLQPSAGRSLRTDMSLHQYYVVKGFLNNKY